MCTRAAPATRPHVAVAQSSVQHHAARTSQLPHTALHARTRCLQHRPSWHLSLARSTPCIASHLAANKHPTRRSSTTEDAPASAAQLHPNNPRVPRHHGHGHKRHKDVHMRSGWEPAPPRTSQLPHTAVHARKRASSTALGTQATLPAHHQHLSLARSTPCIASHLAANHSSALAPASVYTQSTRPTVQLPTPLAAGRPEGDHAQPRIVD